jgi:hypothetical protein
VERRGIYLVVRSRMLGLRWEQYGKHFLAPGKVRWGLRMML